MITNIIKIGNSKGIRIPKVALEESGLGGNVELKVKKGEIKITPADKPKFANLNARLAEKALANDWMRKEEVRAWKSLK